ncbi:tRNA-dihydrouridine(47) synthase [NAD(P)(+)]-like [Hypsibius exemplaris]|uniref:tRNA-dihydrouridine(47) synthase [NAD(P)(+)] n=1 Tax=Hypsibius exemplaris TaxID=2072580 RepID=A0A1W0WC83_HYPEX|nr:tRNA-dihydrouridine(47) synthase [NAD(P)(+)]-like [Hypsibius exemplaris]
MEVEGASPAIRSALESENGLGNGVVKKNSELKDKMEIEEPSAEVASNSGSRGGWEKGVARVKPEFLVKDHVRELDPKFLSAADQEKFGNPDISAALNAETDGKRGPKLKGRNKNRSKQNYREAVKVCSYISREADCPYGAKCRYSHDLKAYMQTKLPDIGDECIIYQRKGFCPYGLTCRFGASHLNADGTNKKADGFVEGSLVSDVKNGMTKDLQRNLRKRTFDFHDGGQQNKRSGKDRKKGRDVVVAAVEAKKSIVESVIEADAVAEDEDVAVADADIEDKSMATGDIRDEEHIRLLPAERKRLNFAGKLYLSPLTTVGNLPYRRICKRLGADITCGEMALANNLLTGQQSEWALMVRHSSEDLFGVQVCGSRPDVMGRLAELLKAEVSVDFVDINCGCPIDLVCNSGSGCALMGRSQRIEGVVKNMISVLDVPLTVKIRTGIHDGKNIAHELIPKLRDWGVSQVSLHGRSREQRYTKLADWKYIAECAEVAAAAADGNPMPLFGNGDVMNYQDYYEHLENTKVAGMLIARGALIKPWIFTEIKERRDWDISAPERFDIFKEFTNFGLEHWGSDTRGVETTRTPRRFLLEWMSFTHRYVPVGLLEQPPQRINERPPHYVGRSDLETLLSSSHCNDWIKLSEMLLGPVVEGFQFLPKHKANAWK